MLEVWGISFWFYYVIDFLFVVKFFWDFMIGIGFGGMLVMCVSSGVCEIVG